jgi:hypothetical protein
MDISPRPGKTSKVEFDTWEAKKMFFLSNPLFLLSDDERDSERLKIL